MWPTQFCFLEVFFLKEILFMHLNVFLLGTGKKRATRWILIANLLFLVPSLGISIHFDAYVFHKRPQGLLFSDGKTCPSVLGFLSNFLHRRQIGRRSVTAHRAMSAARLYISSGLTSSPLLFCSVTFFLSCLYSSRPDADAILSRRGARFTQNISLFTSIHQLEPENSRQPKLVMTAILCNRSTDCI